MNENSSKIKKYFQKAPKRAFWEITKTVFKEEKNACVLTYLEEKEDEKKKLFLAEAQKHIKRFKAVLPKLRKKVKPLASKG